MKTINEYLRSVDANPDLISIFDSLQEAVKGISCAVKGQEASCGISGTVNASGEEQLALDILSDRIMTEVLGKNSLVGLVASEEKEDEERLSSGEYAVCFDPLDGSSLVDVNLAVGTIAGVYRTDTFLGVKGDEMLASMIAVYGPRTTLVLTVGKGVHEFLLNKNREFVLIKEGLKVESGKMFAPGNLRATFYRKDYHELVDFWCHNQYTLRYSGGMVPDINQILLKGKGIFSYPGYKEAPEGKLRLLFECAPIGFLLEQAGGGASDGKIRILEKVVTSIHQRTPVFLGSKEEVKRCEEYLN